MKKEEFLKLFELENIYDKYKHKKSFIFGCHDNLTGTYNACYFLFEGNNQFKVIIETEHFAQQIQQIEVHLILNETEIMLNKNELLKNDIFPFLNFSTNFEASLRFIANFINKILIPKNSLIGHVTTY